MTFSDAEEDHPSSGRSNAQHPPRRIGSSDSGQHDSTSQSRTESGLSNASTASLTSTTDAANSALPGNTLRAATGLSSSSIRSSRGSSRAEHAVSPATAAAVSATNSANHMVNSNKAIDSTKLIEKLTQIQGYIAQTAAAMDALEKEGDMTKINQYNTLVKVLRDLKTSEAKLQEFMTKGPDPSKENNIDATKSTESTSFNGTAVSQANGSVMVQSQVASGTTNGETKKLSMHERLARSQEESEQITAKMRETIGRREELMSRYKATRERLTNLKKQRKDLLQDERQLVVGEGASETPYEDPIPGAETWPLDQLDKSIEEFRALYDKVDQLQSAYKDKVEAMSEKDVAERKDVDQKLEQLMTKRQQLIATLTQLRTLQRAKRAEQGLPDIEMEPVANDYANEPTRRNTSSTERVPTSNAQPRVSANEDREPHRPQENGNGADNDQGQSDADNEDYFMSEVLRKRNPELAAQHQQLDFLKSQLTNMKQLLEVAKADRMKEEKRMLESKARLEAKLSARDRILAGEEPLDEDEEEDEDEAGISQPTSGGIIELSGEQLQDPEILNKYQQISEARVRLGKMEEIMAVISEAKQRGVPLYEVLSPENIAILEDAKNDVGAFSREATPKPLSNASARTTKPFLNVSAPQTPSVNSSAPQTPSINTLQPESDQQMSAFAIRSPKLNSDSASSTLRRANKAGSLKLAENNELCEMERSLNKIRSNVSSINEGSHRYGHEKGAIKKQPQAMWNDQDPKISKVIALQEELKEKKNILEALVKGMGKPSLFNVSDNISDNISDNASEGSQKGETTAATWGSTRPMYSQNQDQSSSDGDLGDREEEQDTDFAAVVPRHSPQQRYAVPMSSRGSLPPKDRSRVADRKSRKPEPPSQISMNNLASASARIPKPKHNKLRGSSVMNTSWERVPQPTRERNYKSPSNTTLQAHNTLSSAMQQLSQVIGVC